MALVHHPITPSRFPEIAALSAIQFGKHRYQSTRRYLEWLYVDHPRPQNMGYAGYNEAGELVAVSQEFLAWTKTSGDCVIAHNLFTYPKTTSGLGGAIVMRFSRMAMVVPGAVPPLTNAYQAARFIEVPIRCFARKLPSLHVATKWLQTALVPDRTLEYRRSQLDRLASKYSISIDTAFDPSRFYFERLEKQHGLETEFLRWRHFADNGPTTLVFHDNTENFAFVTVGLRKNVILARIGDMQAVGPFLVNKVFPILSRLGAAVVLANSRIPTDWPVFEAAGMVPHNPLLRAFVTRRVADPSSVLSPSFSDLGFEAIKTRISADTP